MDLKFCHSDKGDACGGVFPFKENPGLCARCTRLSELEDNPAQQANIAKWSQCKGCGVSWKNMKGDKCGSCELKESAAAGVDKEYQADDPCKTAVEVSQAARSHAMDVRLKRTTPTTESLDIARSTSTACNEGLIFVSLQFQVMTSVGSRGSRRQQTKPDPRYGDWGKALPPSMYLTELRDKVLGVLNHQWESHEGMGLAPEEVQLCWAQNRLFHPEVQSATLLEAYEAHLDDDSAHFYQGSGKKQKTGGTNKNLQMALELHIDKDKFELRCDAVLSKLNRKRSGTLSLYPGHGKRHASTGGLISTFSRLPMQPNKPPGSSANAATKICFTEALTPCDPKSGAVDIVWPAEADSPVKEGLLGVERIGNGASKFVYPLLIGSRMYVAKRFYCDGSNERISSVINDSYLSLEIIRLKSVEWLLEQFNSLARNLNVNNISTDIIVSEGFLIRERPGKPSPASGLSDTEAKDDPAIWLIEPRCSTSVEKYSGTLHHPVRQDKIGMTIAAFTHYVYEASEGGLVLADVQGTKMSHQGHDTLVLFDMMTHSPGADSGVGDHGQEGIHAFIVQHECNFVCQALDLGELSLNHATASSAAEEDPAEDGEA